MTGDACILINRTSKPLDVMVNGRIHTFKPGENHSTTDVIRFAKQQHPRMGTFDPSGMNGEYLIAVKGHDKPEHCTKIRPGEEHKGNKLERFDRTHPDFDQTAASAEPMATGIQPPQRRVAQMPADVVVSNRD